MNYSRFLIRTMMSFILFHQVMQNSVSQDVVTWNDINPDLYHKLWTARWIGCPESVTTDFGVYNFRRSFELSDVPGKFVIHVSGDNRYNLFVNGNYICNGPARGDIEHWNFETVDIAPFLKPGRNVISAIVWNYGDHRPVAQISLRTGFIVQGNSPEEEIVNTGKGWRVIKNEAYTIIPSGVFRIRGYFAAGPGENVNASKYPWGWQLPDYDDSYWKHSTLMEYGHSKKMGTDIYRCLQPRSIPLMEETQQDLASVRREEGVYVDPGFLRGQKEIIIPPNTTVKILFDQGVNTVAYPELITSAGNKAMIVLTYSEAMFDRDGNKGNRNEIEGKHIAGYSDIFISDGGENRTFRTLWYRTFRYLELQVRTAEEALVIRRLHSYFTAYPFRENASFDCSDPSLKNIWNVGWRTARLCAGETYVDCPYYEQLQYVGDTRIQALISLYVSGDDWLMRNAITLLDDSRIPEGITRSRYPSYLPQNIPPFSLYWINMIHDYWRYRDDSLFVKSFLPGIEAVLGWFERKLDTSNGLLGPMPYWNFVDWAPEWNGTGINSGGTPGGGITGGSAILSLQFVKAMQDAAEIFRAFGDKTRAAHYNKLSAVVIKGVRKHCWDEKRMYFSDTPEKKEFSQHVNILAVLTGCVSPSEQKKLIIRVAGDQSLIKCTYFFRFYLTRAMKMAGVADMYTDQLNPWKDMLALGLTTFAEKPEPVRSDCHAWSASPNYDFLATVCGIEPGEPGFRSVKIQPAMGKLQWIEGKMPHPGGEIKVKLIRKGSSGIEGEVILPPGLKGIFIWEGKSSGLKAGSNNIICKR